MIGHITLAPHGWGKLVTKLIDKSLDLESPTLLLHIDVKRSMVTVAKTNKNKNNITFSYQWDIIKVKRITQSYSFELSGQALIHTLEKLNPELPIKITLIDLFTFQLENRPAPGLQYLLFNDEPSTNRVHQTKVSHKLEVSPLDSLCAASIKVETDSTRCYQCERTAFVHNLTLIKELNKEGNSNQQRLNPILSFQTPNKLYVMANKGTWFSSLTSPIINTSSSQTNIAIEISASTATSMMDILKRANGTHVSVMVDDNTIRLSQRYWQCTLPSTPPGWITATKCNELVELKQHLFSEVPKEKMTHHLPKLNTANQTQKGRIWLESIDDNHQLLNLDLLQDDTHSTCTVELKQPIFEKSQRVSLSLWSLEKALRHFQSTIYWHYNDRSHSLVLIDKGRENQIILYADTAH